MTIRMTALGLALAIPTGLAAQTIVDVSNLNDIEDIDVMTVDGENLGEVEAVLVDATGTIVGLAVEVGGFLGIGDSDRVIALDRLTYLNGAYSVEITKDEVEQLPEWDD